MQIRISGGKDRGRMLKTLKGDLTRPTTGRVKEALFSIIGPRIQGARFLDPFGGSGAVSLEALSRGASHATIIEQNPQALKVIEENVSLLGYQGQVSLLRGDAIKVLERVAGPIDLVFLDPPYRSGVYEQAMAAILPLLSPEGWVIAEHAASIDIEAIAPLQLLKSYKYSDTILSVYGKTP